MSDAPNPGSREAVSEGCTCPVIDNHYGRGVSMTLGDEPSEPMFWYAETCPLHVTQPLPQPPESEG